MLRWMVVFALLLAACEEDPAVDGGPAMDGGGASDGGAPPDGGPVADGAVAIDGGGGDAGALSDGGLPDPSCALPAPFDEGVTYTADLVVAEDGSDETGDGSDETPLATIREAARRATPGTRITVRAGTYGIANLGVVQGTAEAPIAFVADGAVTLDASAGTGWSMTDATWVVVEGFTIVDAAIHGMNLDDGGTYDTPAHHLVLRDLTIRDAGSGGNNDCIKMSGVDDFWILDSDVSGCDRGEIVDMVGCHRGVIAGNFFHEPLQNGVQTKGGSADVLIHGNRFERIPGRAVNAGGSTGLEFFRPLDAPYEAARIRVIANTFVDNGPASGAAVAYVGCDGCEVLNNTIVNPQTWVLRILQESQQDRFVPSRNGVFANNLVVLDTADLRTFFNVGSGTAPETFVFEGNQWFARDEGGDWSGPSFGGTGIPAEMDPILQEDPMLDGTLAPRAPRTGVSRDPGTPDFGGRCFGDPPQIGAWAAE